MSEQRRLDLFTRSRRTDPASSADAAQRARPRANSDAARILEWIEKAPGMSARGLAAITKIEPYVVRKRTADLRHGRFAHAHARPEGSSNERELRWYPGWDCLRCQKGEWKR